MWPHRDVVAAEEGEHVGVSVEVVQQQVGLRLPAGGVAASSDGDAVLVERAEHQSYGGAVLRGDVGGVPLLGFVPFAQQVGVGCRSARLVRGRTGIPASVSQPRTTGAEVR